MVTDFAKRKAMRVLIIGGIFIVLMNFVIAAWLVMFEDDFTASVTGRGIGFEVIQTFPDISVDTSEGSATIFSYLDINFTRPMTIQVNLTDEIEDLTGGTCDYANDCELAWGNSPSVGPSGTHKDITEGLHQIGVRLSCQENSCDALHTITFHLEEYEEPLF